MSDFKFYTDEDVKAAFRQAHSKRMELETEMLEWQEREKECQQELDRRQLEQFWQAHPGLRLEVGDKLLVTQSAVDAERTIKTSVHILELGDIAQVIDFDYEDNRVGIKCREWFRRISLHITRHMRAAYLQQEGAK